jgi:predicted dienelactone hydrolase
MEVQTGRRATGRGTARLATLGLALSLLLFNAGCVTVWQGLTPQGPPAESESARRLKPGPWKVVREDLRLVDGSRPTPEYGENHGAPDRTLETSVWVPVGAPGRSPLVVYSHGFLSDRDEAAYLAEHLASHGYVVASADFPLSSRRAASDPTVLDVVHQPGDVSFLIDWMLGRHPPSEPADPVAGFVYPEQIAAVGLSLGGLTSTLIAFHPELRDPRVRAAVSIAGPVSPLPDRIFQTAPVPFLMIASPDDAVIDYATNGAVLLDRAPTAVQLTVHGASHAGFAGISSRVFRFWPNPDSVGCWYLERHLEHAEELERLVAELGLEADGVEQQPCRAPWWRRTMRPRRQHAITTLAVRAFLDAEFGDDAELREAARRYLTLSMTRELEEVDLAGSGIAPSSPRQ